MNEESKIGQIVWEPSGIVMVQDYAVITFIFTEFLNNFQYPMAVFRYLL